MGDFRLKYAIIFNPPAAFDGNIPCEFWLAAFQRRGGHELWSGIDGFSGILSHIGPAPMRRRPFIGCLMRFERFSGLILLGMLSGCSSPPNNSMRQWVDSASFAVGFSAGHATNNGVKQEIAEALSIYYFALGVLAEGGVLSFREEAYADLVARAAADLDSVAAMAEVGGLLARAGNEGPPQGLPSALHGVAPPRVDRRMEELARDAAEPVRRLLAVLARGANPEAQQVLARVGEGHAMIVRLAGRWRQQESLRVVRAMEAELRLAAEMLPAAPLPDRGHLAAVLLP